MKRWRFGSAIFLVGLTAAQSLAAGVTELTVLECPGLDVTELRTHLARELGPTAATQVTLRCNESGVEIEASSEASARQVSWGDISLSARPRFLALLLAELPAAPRARAVVRSPSPSPPPAPTSLARRWEVGAAATGRLVPSSALWMGGVAAELSTSLFGAMGLSIAVSGETGAAAPVGVTAQLLSATAAAYARTGGRFRLQAAAGPQVGWLAVQAAQFSGLSGGTSTASDPWFGLATQVSLLGELTRAISLQLTGEAGMTLVHAAPSTHRATPGMLGLWTAARLGLNVTL